MTIPTNYGDTPADAGTQSDNWLAPWYGQSFFPQQNAAPSPAPWGVAPPLSNAPTLNGPMQYAPAAPPPLPQPGQWNSSQSSMTGAPLTPNNTGYPYPAIPPSTSWGNPNVAQWEAGMNLLNSQGGLIGAKRGYEGKLPAKWTAEGNVLDARQRSLGTQSAYLNEQARANSQRMTAEQGIQAAKKDSRNIIAVAHAQRDQDNTDYRYRIAGLSAPIDITIPDGYQGALPPGVRARMETIADKLTRQETDSEKMRQFNLEAARIATAASGLEVSAAEIAAGRVSLTLEQAEQAVRLAGLDVDQAQLAASATKMPPAPGLVWDDEGGQWVNATDLKEIEKRRELGKAALAPFDVSELITMLNGPAPNNISPATFRSELTRRGYLDSTVDYLLQLAAIRKSNTAAIYTPPIGTNVPAPGSGSGATQPTGPTTAVGSPLPTGAVAGNRVGTLLRP